MTAKQYISEALETFTDKQLAEVAQYVNLFAVPRSLAAARALR